MVAHRFDGARLHADMTDRGWLATDLAKAAKVGRHTVYRALNGERHSPRTWRKLAKALGKEVRDYRIGADTRSGSH